jgi:hypothetical protein
MLPIEKALHMVVDTPWLNLNMVFWRDLKTPAAKEEICHYSSYYSTLLSAHRNDLVVILIMHPSNDG